MTTIEQQSKRRTKQPGRGRRVGLVIGIVTLAVLVLIAGAFFWFTVPRGQAQAMEFDQVEIGPELAEARVLALGEATHGNAEFQTARQQLLAKLPQFRAVAWEEDYGSVALVNDYIAGGPGTAEEAVENFGFVLTHTAQTVELVEWLREQNAGRPAQEQIQLIGIDTQRYEANKQLALAQVARTSPELAPELDRALVELDDDIVGDEAARAAQAAALAVQQLIEVLAANDDGSDEHRVALNAAAALQQGIELDINTGPGYAELRAQIMADNLRRTVAEQAARGNQHTALFAHDGDVDKTAAAFSFDDLGALAAAEWGEGYRAIGTDFVDSTFISGQRGDRWEVSMTNLTPLRGIFAGTEVGYLECAAADQENRELLDRPVRMASAGESFSAWQAWVPPLNSVSIVPCAAYDALIMVDRATPVTPI